MKNKIKFGICIMIIVLSLSNHWAIAQFQSILFSSNNSWETVSTPIPVGAIAIGTGHPSGFNLPSAFVIDGNRTNPVTTEVFRTDCPSLSPSNLVSAWRMLVGGSEIGGIFNNLATPNDLTLQSSKGLGSMIFNTTDSLGGSYEHMRITGKTGSQEGYVLITHNGYTGVGDFDPNTVFRVVGDSLGGWYNDIVKVAEFRRDSSNRQETAINIRGQRNTLNSLQIPPSNVASILLSNFNDKVTNPYGILGVEYIMGKIAAGLERPISQTGNLSFWTNQGDLNNGLQERARINHLGYFGINLITPTNRLEIHVTDTTVATAPPVTIPHNTFTYANTLNGYGTATGFSGLRFTDLRSTSIPRPTNPGQGVLALDANGDVIYIPDNPGAGLCPSLPSLTTASAGLSLGNFNFYFGGQGIISPTNSNSVGIGYSCSNLSAKLDVLQASGSTGTIGIKGENDDPPSIINGPSIGFKSTMTYSQWCQPLSNVAGWFKAPPFVCLGAIWNQYAIFVPPSGGDVSIGYAFTSYPVAPPYLLDVNSKVKVLTLVFPSDSVLKTKIVPLNHGLDVLRGIHVVSFNYNGKGGIDTTGRYFGTIAEQLARVAPYAIDTNYIKLDSTDTQLTPVLNVDQGAVLYTTINAVKQLDSITAGLSKQVGNLQFPVNNGLSNVNDTIQLGGSALVHNTELPLNNNTFSFTDPTSDSTSNNHVNIGGNDSIYSNPLLANLPYKLGVFNLTEANGEVIGTIDNPSTAALQKMLYIYHGGLSNAHTLYGIQIIIDSGVAVSSNKNMNVGLNTSIKNSLAPYNYGIQSGVQNSAATYNYGLNTTTGGGLYNYGIHTTAQNGNDTASTNYGINTSAINGLYNYGIYSTATGGTINYGGQFNASGKTNTNVANIGIWATASGGAINCGVYGEALPSSDSTPPIGPNYAGYFNGDVVRTGTDNFSSDSILKRNIKPFKNALNIIKQLRPRTFEFKTNKYPYLGLASGNQYGFIAQDVEPLLPVLVKNVVHPAKVDTLGNIIRPALHYKAINYQGFIPILIEGIKELSANKDSTNNKLNGRIDSLVNVVDTLESVINRCCSNKNDKTINQNNNNDNSGQNGTPSIHNIELANNAILYQNAPNPFGNGTIIKYFVPDYTDAQIVFYDEFGNQLKKYNIEEKGMGQLNVDASNLSSGMYSYSLVVNGKVIDSKKMICSK